MLLGEHEVPVSLFFFLSLSNKDVNSSSELADLSMAEGSETVRLAVASDVGVLKAGRCKGEEGGSAGELSALSQGGAL